MTQEEALIKQVELFEDLMQNQSRLLAVAAEIIEGKNRLIELCELETDLHRIQNVRLQRVVFGLFILLVVSSIMHIVR
jgi:hypothetical protein